MASTLKCLWLTVFILLALKCAASLAHLIALVFCQIDLGSNRSDLDTLSRFSFSMLIFLAAFSNGILAVITIIMIVFNALIDRFDFALEALCVTLAMSFIYELTGGIMALGTGDIMYYRFVTSVANSFTERVSQSYRCCGKTGPKGFRPPLPEYCCPSGKSCSLKEAYQTGCEDLIYLGGTCFWSIGIAITVLSGLSLAAAIVLALYLRKRDREAE